MSVTKSVNDTTKIFGAVMTLGLFGLVLLIVFGNLSGNLGFDSLTTTYTNESGYALNDTTYTLTGQSTSGFESLTVSTVHNATDGSVILSGNYTVDSTAGTIVGSPSRTANWTEINVTYAVTYQGNGEQDTNAVITNVTSGAVTFFSFSGTWFTLLAVTLLIIIALSIVAVVRGNNKSGEFSS